MDQARAKARFKPGVQWPREQLSSGIGAPEELARIDLLALDEARGRRELEQARPAQVVNLREFGNLSQQEIAKLVGVIARTLNGDWRFAKAWLLRRARGGTGRPPAPRAGPGSGDPGPRRIPAEGERGGSRRSDPDEAGTSAREAEPSDYSAPQRRPSPVVVVHPNGFEPGSDTQNCQSTCSPVRRGSLGIGQRVETLPRASVKTVRE